MLTIRGFNLATARRAMLAGLTAMSLGTANAIAAESSGLQVVFFPSIASVSDSNKGTMTIQGRVFTPAKDAHALLVGLAAERFKVKSTDEPFHSRARLFFSDSKRDAHVSIKLGNRTIELPASDRYGFFSISASLTAEDLKRVKDGVISFESVASTTGGQTVRGTAVVVPRDAIVVVTDMDDTIKDTNVLNHVSAELNTFVNKFKPVVGMPKVYQDWKAGPGASVHFHVVSAGPWQLYQPLRDFTDGERFPPFSWDMRSVDIGFNLEAISELQLKPKKIYDHKVQKILALLKRLPNQVVLVGDSGETDPEVYAYILNSCPNRVAAIFIREIDGAMPRDYDKLFKSNSGVKPQRFKSTSDLPTTLTPLKTGSKSQCR